MGQYDDEWQPLVPAPNYSPYGFAMMGNPLPQPPVERIGSLNLVQQGIASPWMGLQGEADSEAQNKPSGASSLASIPALQTASKRPSGGRSAPSAPSRYDDLVAQLEAAGKANQGRHEQNLKDTENQLRATLENSYTPLDLSPVVGLVDNWTGSNLGAYYNRPDYSQTTGAVRALQEGLKRGRVAIGDDQVAMLEKQLGIENQREMAKDRAAQLALQQKAARDAAAERAADRADRNNFHARQQFEEKFGQKMRDSYTFQSNLKEFQDLIARNGGTIPKTGPERQRAESLYADMTVAYKNPAGLGALAGPDTNIIKGVLGPNDLTGFIASAALKGGDAGVIQSLQDVSARNQRNFDLMYSGAEGVYKPVAGDLLSNYRSSFDNVSGRAQPAAQEMSPEDQATTEWAKNNPNDPVAIEWLKAHGG